MRDVLVPLLESKMPVGERALIAELVQAKIEKEEQAVAGQVESADP